MARRLQWIKLPIGYHDRPYCKALRRQPNGAECYVTWLLMLDLAAQHPESPGTLPFTHDMADDDIALMLDTQPPVVALVRDLTQRLGVLGSDHVGHMVIPELEQMVGSESESARRMRSHRRDAPAPQRQALLTDDLGQNPFEASLLPAPADLNSRDDFVAEAITYLNHKRGSRYSPETGEWKRLLCKLHDRGFSVADVRLVVNGRIAEWENDVKMDDFITPATLFAESNFEKYLMNAEQKNGSAQAMAQQLCVMCRMEPVDPNGDGVCDDCREAATTGGDSARSG